MSERFIMSRSTIRLKRACKIFLLGCLFLVCVSPAKASATSKALQLERKIADLTLLRQQLEDRSNQSADICAALAAQQKALEDEIHFLVKNEKIENFEAADKNLRIHYNMILLGSVMAYSQQLNNKILEYRVGQDKLTYLQKLAQDDIKMIAALDDLRIDALMTQISLVINEYLPDAHIIQLVPEAIEPLAPRTVWKMLQSKKNQGNG